MQLTRRPIRIAFAVFLAMVVCQIGFGLAVATIRSRTNEQAEVESVRLMASRLAQMHDGLSSVTSDYNLWNDAYDAVVAGDLAWIYDNYAATATTGDLFDGLILMDGPVPEPWAWSAINPRTEPSPSFLPPDILDRIRAEVAKQTLGVKQTFDLITVIDGQLTLLSATHTQPYDPARLEGLEPADAPVAVFADTLDSEALASLAEALFVEDLTFGSEAAPGQISLPLPGPDGQVLGFLFWMPPRPGDSLVRGMAPVLIAMGLLNTALGGAAAWLTHSRARQLIREGAQAEKLAQQAERLARTDAMTGLPNRLAFSEHLVGLDQERAPQVAVLFIDLNGFKSINDSIGHAGGDALVAAVAERLARCTDDTVFLARLGGDEFVLVASGQDGITLKSGVLAKVIGEVMAPPFSVLGTTIHVTLSQGLALRLDPGTPLDELVRRADLAMYRAKQDRLVDAQVYTPELDGDMRRDREMEQALRAALDRPEEFSILYQPVVQARDHHFLRAEALARWTSAELGAVPPNLFIPLAERAGLMSRLGALLLHRIFGDLARCPSLRVSINLSPVQMRDPRFLSELDACLARHEIGPERIEFELTEGVMIDRADRARIQLAALRQRGFSIALDDFGTGYSSIGYLTSMPFDTLKIDQVFLTRGEDLMKNLALIRSIVHLGHTMGKTVVCEGVETLAQAVALSESGCDELQGYHFARPMPLASLVAAHPGTLTLVA